MHVATANGHKEVGELVIAKGADVNVKDNDGETPLDSTIRRKQAEIADLLRKHGGKTSEQSKAGRLIKHLLLTTIATWQRQLS